STRPASSTATERKKPRASPASPPKPRSVYPEPLPSNSVSPATTRSPSSPTSRQEDATKALGARLGCRWHGSDHHRRRARSQGPVGRLDLDHQRLQIIVRSRYDGRLDLRPIDPPSDRSRPRPVRPPRGPS